MYACGSGAEKSTGTFRGLLRGTSCTKTFRPAHTNYAPGRRRRRAPGRGPRGARAAAGQEGPVTVTPRAARPQGATAGEGSLCAWAPWAPAGGSPGGPLEFAPQTARGVFPADRRGAAEERTTEPPRDARAEGHTPARNAGTRPRAPPAGGRPAERGGAGRPQLPPPRARSPPSAHPSAATEPATGLARRPGFLRHLDARGEPGGGASTRSRPEQPQSAAEREHPFPGGSGAGGRRRKRPLRLRTPRAGAASGPSP